MAAAGGLGVDGSVAHSPVLNGGILQGIGTVPVFSTTSGDDSTVAPGLTVGSTAAGQLTASGNVTLNTGDTFSLRLGVAASTDSDSLNIGANTLTLNNATLALNVGSLVSSATPDQLYDIVVGTSGDNTAANSTSMEARSPPALPSRPTAIRSKYSTTFPGAMSARLAMTTSLNW